MATSPAADTASLLTDEPLWIMATGVRMLRRSQMRAERSSEPDTTWLASWVNTADVTVSWWPCKQKVQTGCQE